MVQMKRFNDQDYEKLFQQSLFLPGYLARRDSGVKWVRATEMLHDGRLFSIDAVSSTVVPGAFGVWAVSAARLLALHPQLFKAVIPAAAAASRTPIGNPSFGDAMHPGVFRFRFYKFGTWTEVVVDDFLPCTEQGGWLCSFSGDRRELWVPLLEKAFAKLNGCYQMLSTLKTSTSVFVDLTGNVAEEVSLSAFAHDVYSDGALQLFDAMRSLMQRKALISCYFHDYNPLATPAAAGLCSDMYAVTGVTHMRVATGFMQYKRIKVVRLRKPFLDQSPIAGQADPNWTSLLVKELELELDPSVQRDGQFYVSFERFLCKFPTMLVCRVFDQPASRLASLRVTASRSYGRWSVVDGSAGGNIHYPACVAQNPQFLINVRRPCEMVFYLQRSHTNHPALSTSGGGIEIGFFVLKVEENRAFRVHDVGYPLHYLSNYTAHREVLGRCAFDPGRYVLIPTTDMPDKEGDFLLRAYAVGSGTRMKPLLRDFPSSIPTKVLIRQPRAFGPSASTILRPNILRIEIVSCENLAHVQPAPASPASVLSRATLVGGSSLPARIGLPSSRTSTSTVSSASTSSAVLRAIAPAAPLNPYCIVRFSEESPFVRHVTHPKYNTSDPLFNSSYVFCVKSPKSATVRIEVWSSGERFMVSRSLGHVVLAVAEFASPLMHRAVRDVDRLLTRHGDDEVTSGFMKLRVMYDGMPTVP
ncbi:hypothetical protein HK105_203564 [Polyrhizophydium stewartii]|uniref:Calpain-like cysteine peptidase n=1 Tax=Polyrhizophydium stewartii TaxID=2732419 RepID=A0ABR4NB84_9FUNG